MAKKKVKEQTNESILLSSNERLLSSRGYIICTVDNDKGEYSFNADLTKLNLLEVQGFLKIVQENLGDLWSSIDESQNPQQMEDDD